MDCIDSTYHTYRPASPAGSDCLHPNSFTWSLWNRVALGPASHTSRVLENTSQGRLALSVPLNLTRPTAYPCSPGTLCCFINISDYPLRWAQCSPLSSQRPAASASLYINSHFYSPLLSLLEGRRRLASGYMSHLKFWSPDGCCRSSFYCFSHPWTIAHLQELSLACSGPDCLSNEDSLLKPPVSFLCSPPNPGGLDFQIPEKALTWALAPVGFLLIQQMD